MLQGVFEFALSPRQIAVAHQRRDPPTHDGLVEAATRIDVGQALLDAPAPALQQTSQLAKRAVDQ